MLDLKPEILCHMKPIPLGVKVRARRKALKISQRELAEISKLSVRSIQRIEKNEVSPHLHTIKVLSRALTIDLAEGIEYDASELIVRLRATYKKRKFIKKASLAFMALVVSVGVILSPMGLRSEEYDIFMLSLIGLGLIAPIGYWRCPGCDTFLGNFHRSRYCGNCGLKLE